MEKISSPEFESIKYEDPKKEETIFEIYKNQDWDKIVPRILDSIDNSRDGNNYGDYPYFRIQNSIKFLPELDVPSDILSDSQLKELHSRLPYYHQYTGLKRVFSISIDGCALKSFYNKVEGINNTILAIKDDEGNVFGAYASEAFAPISNFFGTGECFLYSFYKDNKISVFNSTGLNDHYIYCDNDQVCFGCSDDYFSLALRNDFLDGYSKSTQTYKNEPLSYKEKFTIVKFEVWTFREK